MKRRFPKITEKGIKTERIRWWTTITYFVHVSLPSFKEFMQDIAIFLAIMLVQRKRILKSSAVILHFLFWYFSLMFITGEHRRCSSKSQNFKCPTSRRIIRHTSSLCIEPDIFLSCYFLLFSFILLFSIFLFLSHFYLFDTPSSFSPHSCSPSPSY